MNRLDFIKKSAVMAGGALVGVVGLAQILGLSSCNGPKKKVIGLQLYSLRDAMDKDVPATLKAVADMGYKNLETAGYWDDKLYGYTPAEFRKLVEDLGMKVTGAHLAQNYTPETDATVMAWWDKALDDQAAAGCLYAVQPSFPIGATLDDVKIYCDYFGKVSEMAKAKGMTFGYHNHVEEFATLDGEVIYDYMINNTPKDMAFEMDAHWVKRANADPIAYLKKYPGRFPIIHVKDESIIGESGYMDYAPIFAAAYEQGLKEFYVEVAEYTLPPDVCVQRSFDYLETADFV